jgi:nanoRNase/pAp phosphatase (c-di-AMP/oligoRNAs hydrolase)
MLNKLLEDIKKAEKITLFKHVNPDGDASGSTFGLKEIIELN